MLSLAPARQRNIIWKGANKMSVDNLNDRAIQQIANQLRRRGARIEQAAKRVLRETAEEIVQAAKSRAPVKTGNLRDSIHLEEENDGLTFKITADAKNQSGECYAKIVEFSPKINQPFLQPALDANRNLNRRIRQAVRSEI